MIDQAILRTVTDAELSMLLNDYQAGAVWVWAKEGCRAAEALLGEAVKAVQAELCRRGVGVGA